jgi:hypothetical protein
VYRSKYCKGRDRAVDRLRPRFHLFGYLVLDRFRQVAKARVDHRAQITSRGWKSNRTRRAASESSPKASLPSKYCHRFPGKIIMKNAAVTHPIIGNHFLGEKMRARPSASSTTPESRTTNSGAGIHGGTWARNSLAEKKCPNEAKRRNSPNAKRAIVLSTCLVLHDRVSTYRSFGSTVHNSNFGVFSKRTLVDSFQ